MSRVALGRWWRWRCRPRWPARAADDCGAALKVAQPWIAAADGARIAFVSRPAPLPVGQHFDLDFVVCAAAAVRADAAIQVDADMPAHRHGMNYRATVSTLSPGRLSRPAA